MRKFDPARVIQDSELFQEPRPPASPGEARAVERIAAMLSEAGWEVEQFGEEDLKESSWSILSRSFRESLGWAVWAIALYAWFWHSFTVLLPTFSLALRLTTSAALLAVLGLLQYRKSLRDRRKDELFPSRLIVASLSRKGSAGRRLVVTTPAANAKNLLLFVLLKCSNLLLISLMGSFLITLSIPIRPRYCPNDSMCIGAFLAALTVAQLLDALFEPAPALPCNGDNRTSLAFMAELARTWPNRVALGLETWLVVSPMRFSWRPKDFDRLLPQLLSDGLPTLILRLNAVGVGPEVGIAGNGPSAELVCQSAESLRIPFRRIWKSNTTQTKPPSVWLVGSANDLPFASSMIGATAQIVTETAFRWARSE